jgi:hypothetical protein
MRGPRVTVLWPIAIALALVAPWSGRAQSAAGNQEFGFAGAFLDLTEDEEDAILVLSLHYGRFFSDAFAVGGGILMGGPISEADEDVELEVFAQYHFSPEKTTTWYAKGVYAAIFEELDIGFVGAGFGFKAYWRDNVAFSWELGYGISVTSAVEGGAVRSITGLSYVF